MIGGSSASDQEVSNQLRRIRAFSTTTKALQAQAEQLLQIQAGIVPEMDFDTQMTQLQDSRAATEALNGQINQLTVDLNKLSNEWLDAE